MPWLALVIAGCAEVCGVIFMKQLAMKNRIALLYLIISFGISLYLLSYAMQTIPMGTAYGVWTGIGTVGSTLVGMFLYGESKDWRRIFCIALIVASAVGLKLMG